MNSDNENLFIYDENGVATFGSVPYDKDFEYSKNTASHLLEPLYLNDNNIFNPHSFESENIKKTYKI